MKPPFSNGTEGEAWMSNWCDQCAEDHDTMHVTGDGPGCGLVCIALIGEDDIAEWVPTAGHETDYWRHLPARVTCLRFRACPCAGHGGGYVDPGPGPVPVHPDQLAMFEADDPFTEAFAEIVDVESELV